MRSLSRAVLGLGIAAGAVVLAAGPALADPPSGITPAPTDIVSVGSDTIQAVEDQFSLDYNAQSPAPASSFYSFDATGTSTITTKSGCAAITRPNGSGAGISALKAGAKTGSSFCVDIARSSRGPAAGDGSNGALAFVAFAKDAVTWSANSTTNAPKSLTTQQLDAIYSCDASILGKGATGPVTWNEVGGKGTAKVEPVIPQAASGTRAFFLSKIGVTTLGTCVQPANSTVEENEGIDPIFTTNSANIVFPYSVAVYLAQSVHGHSAGMQGKLKLHSVNGTAPTTGTGAATKINPAFPYSRSVYNVVRDSGTSTHVPGYLQPLLGSGNNSGWICTNSTAQSDISSFGFLSLGSNCGSVVVAPNGS